MLTANQQAMLNQSLGSTYVAGYDDTQGNTIPTANLLPMSSLWLVGSGVYYDAKNNAVTIARNGAVLNGFDLRGVRVAIWANNVTVSNCLFDDKQMWYSVTQNAGYSGMTVKNCTFIGGDNNTLAAFIYARGGYATITNNQFINVPSHDVDINCGVVSNNYFSGAGYETGAHADAINVLGTSGPVLITGNFIDWTNNADAAVVTNNAIRVTNEGGPVSDVTITNNIILGGQYSVYVGYGIASAANGSFTNVVVSNNYIGDYVYGAYYHQNPPGVTLGSYVDVGFNSSALSESAWNDYLANGIDTNSLVVASASSPIPSAPAAGTVTLYGAGVAGAHLYGGKSLSIYVGGSGTQYLMGSSGVDIYTYLAVADSLVPSSDLINYFNVANDVIDLHALNAAPSSSTPVNFTFIGGANFSSAGGEVRVVQDVAHNQTLVQADLVGDSSTDLQIRIVGLLNLTADNFILTSDQYAAEVAPFSTIDTFLSLQAALDQIPGGFSIVDSAANILPNLDALQADAGNINAITATGAVVSVNVATFLADQTILNDVVGGFAVADTGANILAQLDALQQDAGAIKSVTLSDSSTGAADVLALSSARVTSDAAILADIVSPYVLDVVTATSATMTGVGAGLTIPIANQGVATTVTGGAAMDTFYLSANFGAVEITDWHNYAGGSKADTLSLSKTDFADWATLLSDGVQRGSNVVFTAADGARLTLDWITMSALTNASAALKAEFQFHA